MAKKKEWDEFKAAKKSKAEAERLAKPPSRRGRPRKVPAASGASSVRLDDNDDDSDDSSNEEQMWV